MDINNIQSQCEAFLKSLPYPGFIVIGLQRTPEQADLIYSLHDMPLKSAVKGVTKTLDDLVAKL